ncbi:ACT domain-containing protein [Oceaniovalibus sp. ACAM 378]|uniref:ACT domain-containing protein n=1 Tax=Oceaniovalibus sp. ACAM 378 TaxID=2599923 RepID=UPI0011D78D75|nr:ACT domain-containing protein [Oceaniovalibus sp. ACAM 378]TYB84013.1 ACT domain-containing protein [Oceaniovalibus sp. ACAM 378]
MPEVALTAYDIIAGMTPTLTPGVFMFITTDDPARIKSLSFHAVSTFKEAEGMSLLVPAEVAEEAGLDAAHPMRCITLNVYSSLEGVGLTAAVSTALGDAGIPCNMIAAYHHDHVFVPSDKASKAMDVLARLQAQAN